MRLMKLDEPCSRMNCVTEKKFSVGWCIVGDPKSGSGGNKRADVRTIPYIRK